MSYDNLVIVLAVAAAVPFLLALVPRLPLPGPVLEIVAGVVLGPAVLNWVQPDGTVEALSVIGLGFLLFLAGLEIDFERWRGPAARLVGLGLAATLALAAAVGWSLDLAGLVESPLLVGIALVATSLGLLIPVLKDAGAADRPVGQLVIGGASAGEFCAVILLSLFFSEHASGLTTRLLLLLGLACLTVLVVVTSIRATRSRWLSRTVTGLADTSAQIRVRLTMLLIVGLSALAMHLGFEAVLGAFVAGAVLSLVDPDAESRHPQFHTKLDGIGYGFLVPVFFVTSGIQFDLVALFADAGTVLRVPLFLAALLLVRGLPALLYRRAGLSRAELVAAGFLQATSLPLIVAAATIGVRLDAIRPENAAALVAAGLLSCIVFPLVALPLLGRAGTAPARGDGPAEMPGRPDS
ncbi:cation:proton antiporter [Streptomyces sp. Vc74B-19]|uniref:cation:proton antiporter n=1 Tax=unclassified Streptomyces TaxID=2593676 RepID=UPI001BFC0B6E|nr:MULTISPECIES: cation:proton antiporter [unclassified Streptomyces]MBT3166197.1 cation:proton antiporter [Streptomyces sp. Vc74B-19]MCO4696529.1 cation:proton antiporter [Streptomyces sp. RO-S4]MDU0302829.1 cation:proton antiporter [Streptomyces sp. PAL114]